MKPIKFEDERPYVYGEKLKLVQHPDGYYCTLPAHYSDERVQSYIELTRKHKTKVGR